MEIHQGYSYHIRDEFFDLVNDRYLMSNKENENYRPHFYAIQDKKNPALYWMIPISSQVGKENIFLIQNTFPIIEKYFDHVHTIEAKPVTVHKELNEILTENLREVLAMHSRGTKLTFTDIDAIKMVMERELKK